MKLYNAAEVAEILGVTSKRILQLEKSNLKIKRIKFNKAGGGRANQIFSRFTIEQIEILANRNKKSGRPKIEK